jgi:hypothetical protein
MEGTVVLDGMRFEVNGLTWSPSSPDERVDEVSFRIIGPPNERLTEAATDVPLEVVARGRRYRGLFRLVHFTPVHFTTEYRYSAAALAAATDSAIGTRR